MPQQATPTGRIMLNNVRLSFPSLWEAEAFKPGDKPKFKATLLTPQEGDLRKKVDGKILAVLTEYFKGDAVKAKKTLAAIQGNANKFCWQDGDTKSYDGYPGMMALSAKSDVRPSVFDGQKVPLTEKDGKPYAGCYVNASIELFVYNQQGIGLSAQLRGVQFLKDGDAFAAGRPADSDEFEEVTEGTNAADFA
jgi:hypothetical protein